MNQNRIPKSRKRHCKLNMSFQPMLSIKPSNNRTNNCLKFKKPLSNIKKIPPYHTPSILNVFLSTKKKLKNQMHANLRSFCSCNRPGFLFYRANNQNQNKALISRTFFVIIENSSKKSPSNKLTK